MKSYVIKKVQDSMVEKEWENAEIAPLDIEPWKEFPCPYFTFVQLLYSDEAIYVHLSSRETNLRAAHTERNSQVCEDSCMEFFISPDSNDERYMNFEINPIGTLLLHVCKDRDNFEIPEVDEKIFNIKTIITSEGWEIYYKIPFSFINTYFKKISKNMRGNFYKCGRNTIMRHYACWNNIELQEPDFHCPQYFGKLFLN